MGDDMSLVDLARSLATGLAVPSASAATTAAANTPTASEPASAPVSTQAAQSAPAEAPVTGPTTEASASTVPAGQGEPTASTERTMITIHGNQVDITGTDIDPTFLEALPDDMREEVLNQHFREVRSSRPAPQPSATINSEFLDALPPELRAEVSRQDAAPSTSAGPAAAAQEMDAASFFAMLDPQLRQQVLLEQEDGFISTLPPSLLAEANVLRDRQRRRQPQAGTSASAAARQGATANGAAKKAQQPKREAIQLLEKPGLATLVRLLFLPSALRKNTLQKVLVNLAENTKTRIDLATLLLNILQDGTQDSSAVDKSYTQMSWRASKALASTSRDTPKRKGQDGQGLPQFSGENVPNLIAQRCMEALAFLVTSNEPAAEIFLQEQEGLAGLNSKKASAKKGKGKVTAKVPLIVLLGLLERPSMLKVPAITDSLTQLLATVTKPLVSLNKTEAPTATAQQVSTSEQTSGGDATTSTAPSAGSAQPAAAGSSSSAQDAGAKKEEESASAPSSLKEPPVIPPESLRLIVNVLDAGDCSSRSFQHTLSLIQNLATLPDALDVIVDELKLRAQRICKMLVDELNELLNAVKGDSDVRSIILAKLSPASSSQAKLLRILKTLDWNFTKRVASGGTAEKEKATQVYETFVLMDLWQRLGDCLAGIEERPDMIYIATVLLPLIESLMVVSKYVGANKLRQQSPSQLVSPRTPMSEYPPPNTMENLFVTFTDEHRKILNAMVRNNPSLMGGSFAVLVNNSKVLDFDNKRSYFFSVRRSLVLPSRLELTCDCSVCTSAAQGVSTKAPCRSTSAASLSSRTRTGSCSLAQVRRSSKASSLCDSTTRKASTPVASRENGSPFSLARCSTPATRFSSLRPQTRSPTSRTRCVRVFFSAVTTLTTPFSHPRSTRSTCRTSSSSVASLARPSTTSAFSRPTSAASCTSTCSARQSTTATSSPSTPTTTSRSYGCSRTTLTTSST